MNDLMQEVDPEVAGYITKRMIKEMKRPDEELKLMRRRFFEEGEPVKVRIRKARR